MERYLVSLDGSPDSLKIIHYLNRVLQGMSNVEICLFHVLPTSSPNLLKKEEVRRIEKLHEEYPHLGGYFWTRQQEEKMIKNFQDARDLLLAEGFSPKQIRTHYGVESDEIAQIILERAAALRCKTVIVGRRGLSRVKEFFLGSVSKSVVGQARNLTVWVVED